MKKSYARKMTLLSVIAVLLAVYIVQLVSSGRTNVKVFSVAENVDRIIVKNNGKILSVAKEGDGWFAGALRKPCQLNRVNGLLKSASEVKVLGNVGSFSDADAERYGLANPIVVELYSGEKTVRVLEVGKNTATGSQCYAKIDGKQAVWLVQGALKSTYEVSEDEIVEKPSEKESDAGKKPELETL